jgi:hypothetical protein
VCTVERRPPPRGWVVGITVSTAYPAAAARSKNCPRYNDPPSIEPASEILQAASNVTAVQRLSEPPTGCPGAYGTSMEMLARSLPGGVDMFAQKSEERVQDGSPMGKSRLGISGSSAAVKSLP